MKKGIGIDPSVIVVCFLLMAASFGTSKLENNLKATENRTPVFTVKNRVEVIPVIDSKTNKDAVKIGDFMSLAKANKPFNEEKLEAWEKKKSAANIKLDIKQIFSVFSKKKASPPKIVYKTMPDYPIKSVEEAEQGIVAARMYISANGRVEKVEIDKSSGFDALDRSTIAALENWIFDPSVYQKYPTSSWLKIDVRFTLK